MFLLLLSRIILPVDIVNFIFNMAHFKRLVRFEDSKGQIQQGELNAEIPWDSDLRGIEVKTYTQDVVPWSEDFQLSGKSAKIVKVCISPWDTCLLFSWPFHSNNNVRSCVL